jgi:SSS family solute:Na+ symporter
MQAIPCTINILDFAVFLGASIIGFWYWCTDQHIVQRVLGQTRGKDNSVVMKRARRGTIAAGYFKLLPVFMFLIPGMIAIALSNDPNSGISMDITNQHDTDGAFAMMVKNILPVGVKGFVTIGFICALVTSLAAFFNSCAHPLHRRLLQTYEKGKERGALRSCRTYRNCRCRYSRSSLASGNDEHGQPL